MNKCACVAGTCERLMLHKQRFFVKEARKEAEDKIAFPAMCLSVVNFLLFLANGSAGGAAVGLLGPLVLASWVAKKRTSGFDDQLRLLDDRERDLSEGCRYYHQ